MSDAFAVDLNRLADTIEDLERVEEEMAELATRLTKRSTDLHLTWHGRAADAHVAAHGRWDARFAQLRDALDRMRAAAAVARDNYTAAADGNVRMWQQVG